MTYFSKFLINPQRRGARKLLSSPQALHAAVMATNPPDIKNEDGRILWRLDITGHQYVLYVLSPEKPDFSALVEDGIPAQGKAPTTGAYSRNWRTGRNGGSGLLPIR